MKRQSLALGFAATALLALSACSSDSPTSTPATDGVESTAGDTTGDTTGDTATGDTTTGDTAGGNDTLPGLGGLTEECKQLYTKFTSAMGALGTGSSADLGAIWDELGTVLPDELKDDAAVLADAFGKLSDILQQYDGDITKAMADPEAVAAIEAVGSPEVTAASESITSYFEETCPTG